MLHFTNADLLGHMPLPACKSSSFMLLPFDDNVFLYILPAFAILAPSICLAEVAR